MKHLKQLSAGILSAALLLQSAGTLPLFPPPPALTASAYTAQVNQPRIFDYDFNTFQAHYDPVSDSWFSSGGSLMYAETEAVQEITAEDDSSLKLKLNFDERTAAVSKNGTETDCSALFREMLFEPLANLRPEYETGSYFDKATQQYLPLPEPKSFPLTFICAPQFRNSAPASFTCSIRFGRYEYGTLGISMKGDMFTGTAEGSVQIRTAGELQGKAPVVPGTSAGDINFDARVDVSDAVLTCRVAAEDVTASVSDIGMVLADQNCDNRIDGSDINDIIYDIANVPYERRVPDGTVPIISVRQLGLSDLKRVFGENAVNSFSTLSKLEAGEQVDTWYLAYVMPDSHLEGYLPFRAYDYAVRSFRMYANRKLEIEINTPEVSGQPGFAMLAVTVPHDALPAYLDCRMEMNSIGSMPLYLPACRYIAVEPEAPENAQILQIEQPAPHRTAEGWNALAQTFGYEDGEALMQMLFNMNNNFCQMEHCTEGEQIDVWDLACFWSNNSDLPANWEEAVLEELVLDEGNVLFAVAGLYEYSESETPGEDYLWFRMTVPHGTLPADTELRMMLNPEARYRNSSDEKAPSARIIRGVYPAEKVGMPCWDAFVSGLDDGSAAVPADVLAELETPGTWYTYRLYTEEDQIPENEWTEYTDCSYYDYLTVYINTPAGKDGGYFNDCAVESALYIGGELKLKLAEYRPFAQEEVPSHYDRLVITVPKNGLNGMTAVSVQKDPFFDTVRRCAANSEEQPAPNAARASNGIWYWTEADLQKSAFLAATRPDEPFYVVGDIPEQIYQISGDVSISVVDYMTGEPLENCKTELVYPDATTLFLKEPVNTLTLTAPRFRYGSRGDHKDYRLKLITLPKNYLCCLHEQSFDLPEDGSTLHIVFYAFPTDREPNVHFTFRDWSKTADTLSFTAEIAAWLNLTVYDQAGHILYEKRPWERFDCLLPDGTYTVRGELESLYYTFADPESPALRAMYSAEELQQISGSDTITFTVRDGVPDQPEYCFDIMMKPA